MQARSSDAGLVEVPEEYRAWIEEKLSKEDPFTKCAEWTLEMEQAFEGKLRRVRGTVILSNGWEREHWWLVPAEYDGQLDEMTECTGPDYIVDPTEKQFRQEYFGGAVVVLYCPRDESEPEPTGKCPNCGGLCYNGRTCCSDTCHSAYAAYCLNPGTWF